MLGATLDVDLFGKDSPDDQGQEKGINQKTGEEKQVLDRIWKAETIRSHVKCIENASYDICGVAVVPIIVEL